MTYSLSDVMNALMTGIQDTLYYIAQAIADNAQVIATIVIVGLIAGAVMKFGGQIFSGVKSWLARFI